MSKFLEAAARAGDPVKARKSRVKEIFHGVTVKDPYRHLEDLDAKETVAWTDGQQDRFDRFIADFQGRGEMENHLKHVWDYPSTTMPSRYGTKYFEYYNPGLAPQDVLRVRDGVDGEPRVLIDPNTLKDDGTIALSGVHISPSGKYIAYLLSEAGSDAQTLKILDVETGENLPDTLDNCRFTSITWDKDSDDGFSYSYPSEQGDRSFALRYHRIGDDMVANQVFFELKGIEDCFVGLDRVSTGEYDWITTGVGTSRNNGYFARKVGDTGDFKKVFEDGVARYSIVAEIDGYIYCETDYNASKGQLVRFKLDNPSPENWDIIIPEHDTDRIEYIFFQQNKLFVNYNHDCADQLKIFNLNGKEISEVPLPEQSLFSAGRINKEDTKFLINITNFKQPGSIYEYDIETGQLELFRKTEAKADLSDCIVERLYASSKDGTIVPMTVIRHPDTELDGSAALKLYGYGGFNVPLGPFFSNEEMNFVRQGGIFVQANLRGGNEFGKDWHSEGALHNKQNVFDDFIACAEHLIYDNYTSSPRLIIEGGSNGGLLTAACMLQRPELFGAVISAVPVTDMLRFHKFTYGAAWRSDYGDPENNEDDFKVSMSYSPLHNVQKGQYYPPCLVKTADHDDRVVPSHSFKFVAEMQDQASKDSLVLLRVDKSAGHGAGKPTEKVIEEILDTYAFMERSIGPINQADYKQSISATVNPLQQDKL